MVGEDVVVEAEIGVGRDEEDDWFKVVR